MEERIKRIIDDIMIESGVFFSADIIDCNIDGERVYVVCSIESESPLFDMEIDEIDCYINVTFEDNLMIIQGVIFDDEIKNHEISESCKAMYKCLNTNILDRISFDFESGKISPEDYEILLDLCENVKNLLYSIKVLS